MRGERITLTGGIGLSATQGYGTPTFLLWHPCVLTLRDDCSRHTHISGTSLYIVHPYILKLPDLYQSHVLFIMSKQKELSHIQSSEVVLESGISKQQISNVKVPKM